MFKADDFLNYAMEQQLSKRIRKKLGNARKMQISKLGLINSSREQKKQCEKRFKECQSPDQFDDFKEWLEKQIRLTQRKINGNEIKEENKKYLKSCIDLYKSYLEKIKGKTSNS